ncbi:unnamed protein product [Angiostrongylus costaricensis]|uniref:Uncharacterized protein n=1 Tax=Angiostrongylus costaricensis TaxID=334426 RepID=A0A158PMI1_ANGCS|nr:unnamed protein product [Angiostrongylus costaricensis]
MVLFKIYQRRIRKKSDSLRSKYRREDEQQREMENRMKEIANRLKSKIRSIFSSPKFPIFTGGTPLQSSSFKCEEAVPIVDDKTKDPDSYFSTVTTNAVSKLTTTASAGTVTGITSSEEKSTVETVQMEAPDVAATVHAVAKEWQGQDSRPPLIGIIAVPKKRHSSESKQSTAAESATPTGTTTGQFPTTKVELSSPCTYTKSEEPLRTESSAFRAGNELMAVTNQLSNEADQAAPYTGPFFPYWTARRFVLTKVEPNTSPSGRSHGTKIVTSEHSIWAHSGNGRTTSDCVKEVDRSKDAKRPNETQPRDVYELRRKLQRLRANEISLGMKQVLNESRKRNQPSGSTSIAQLRHAGAITATKNQPDTPTKTLSPQKGVYMETKGL